MHCIFFFKRQPDIPMLPSCTKDVEGRGSSLGLVAGERVNKKQLDMGRCSDAEKEAGGVGFDTAEI